MADSEPRANLEDQVRTIAVFLLFALADEALAAEAAERAVSHLKSVFVDPASANGRSGRVRLIDACRRRFEAERAQLTSTASTAARVPVSGEAVAGLWSLPPNSNWQGWVKFVRDGGEEERVALILSRVLKFPDDEIADGLGVSVGTLRHRLGRGARALGAAAAKAGPT
jgi:DNA-directed RNA polymerase specialized sigma24 family protein